MNTLISEHFSEDFPKYRAYFSENLENFLESLETATKLRKKSQESLRTRFETEVYEQNLQVFEETDVRKQTSLFLCEKRERKSRYLWQKAWKRLRLFEGLWKHPDFCGQRDTKFSETEFCFEKVERNRFFFFEAGKYEGKPRAKLILKEKLREPAIVERNREFLKEKKHAILNNYSAILHLAPQKGMNQEKSQENAGEGTEKSKGKFMGDVKKNISNSLKVSVFY